MIRYMIAMEREAELFRKAMGSRLNGEIEVIGVNAVDMGVTTGDDIIVNVGYAGGYLVPVGSLVEPVRVIDIKRWDMIRIDPLFPVESAICFTSDSFVNEPVVYTRAIYDMELFKIARYGRYKRLHCIKIISDNLSEPDCEAFDGGCAWRVVADMVSRYVGDC